MLSYRFENHIFAAVQFIYFEVLLIIPEEFLVFHDVAPGVKHLFIFVYHHGAVKVLALLSVLHFCIRVVEPSVNDLSSLINGEISLESADVVIVIF